MALPKSYLTSTKNLTAILNSIQSAQAPSVFTVRFLEGLGFKSTSDRFIIGVLKSLGFLDSNGKPQDRYFQYLDQTQSAKILAEGIREAYADLFLLKRDAYTMSRADVINKAKTLSQGALGEAVLEKFAMTFVALCGAADFSNPATLATQIDRDPAPGQGAAQEQSNQKVAMLHKSSGEDRSAALSLGGLHYNIQIILPQTRDAAVYDAIFKSLKEHLIER